MQELTINLPNNPPMYGYLWCDLHCVNLICFKNFLFCSWYLKLAPNKLESERDVCFTQPLQPISERIAKDALENHEGTVSIGGGTITNLLFTDNIDGLAGEEEELAKIVECLDKAYGMEISAEKTKLMTHKTSGINTEIKVNGHSQP